MEQYLQGAPHGTKLHCKDWTTEAPYRMLLNNLDPAVAENNKELIVYGGNGKAARDPNSLKHILQSLQNLRTDETLLVQSGKPVGIAKTHPDAPRVLLSNSMLVPHWANWNYFRDLEERGLMMYGQMTAGSWIYIGTQGILQGTYETFAQALETHFGSNKEGRWILSGGLGGMGGAQPLAAKLAGASFLGIDVSESHIDRRIREGYLDKKASSLSEALKWIGQSCKNKEPLTIGLVGNAADVFQEIADLNIIPDLVTDQTSAHDPLNGYIPTGLSLSDAAILRRENPKDYEKRSLATMVKHVEAIQNIKQKGSFAFDYGNNLRGFAHAGGHTSAFTYPGFVPAYVRPLFCEGKGPFRWVALSGDPEDIAVTDRELQKLIPDPHLKKWLDGAGRYVKFQGLPARICWLGLEHRAKAGALFNNLVRTGKVKAPIVIGRDHLDCGSVASPYRETESMKDGSDAVADWPILNALVNTASGATWVSLHHGGGVGIGYSIHAGQVIVADGTPEAEKRLERVLYNDPMMGVIRHVDAGYDEALTCAKKLNVPIPMRDLL